MDDSSPCHCPFCAAPPFCTYDDFSTHFLTTHRPSIFPDPNYWGGDEYRALAGLVVLFEKNFPSVRKVNIELAALVGSDNLRIRRIKESAAFKNHLTQFRLLQEEPCKSNISPSSSPEIITLDMCDQANDLTADLNRDASVILEEIRDISTILKENVDSCIPNDSISGSINLLLPHRCLFCDSRYSTKSGLGLHKKSKHFEEYLLEIEHKYANRRNHPWSDEELSILCQFEMDLNCKGVRYINVALQPFFKHRTHSQIVAIRKTLRYRLIKEKMSFEEFNGGVSPPSPAVLLSPAAHLPLSLPNKLTSSFSIPGTPGLGDSRLFHLVKDPECCNLCFHLVARRLVPLVTHLILTQMMIALYCTLLPCPSLIPPSHLLVVMEPLRNMKFHAPRLFQL